MDANLPAATRRAPLAGNMDTSWLKVIALVFMLIDHLGVAVFGNMTEMRILGRIALPIYAWCLVVGCEYTHDIFRYALRLLLVALISQPINMVALGNPWSKLNILFLLALGVLAIAGIREKRYGSQYWAPLLCYVVLGFVNIDYGWKGLTFVLLLYASRKNRAGLAATFIAFAMFWGASSNPVNSILGMPLTFLAWPAIGPVLQPLFRVQSMVWLALPWLLIPSRVNLKLPKWLGYGFYPLHLLLIVFIRLWMGVPLQEMLSVLWKFA